MAFERLPPARWDELESLRAMLANTARRVERAGGDGRLDPAWTDRIVRAIGRALSECDRARVAGAVLPLRPVPDGASVEVEGQPPVLPLPTEREHASDWLGQR